MFVLVDGVVMRMDVLLFGIVVWCFGVGWVCVEDLVVFEVGIDLYVKLGDCVVVG